MTAPLKPCPFLSTCWHFDHCHADGNRIQARPICWMARTDGGTGLEMAGRIVVDAEMVEEEGQVGVF